MLCTLGAIHPIPKSLEAVTACGTCTIVPSANCRSPSLHHEVTRDLAHTDARTSQGLRHRASHRIAAHGELAVGINVAVVWGGSCRDVQALIGLRKHERALKHCAGYPSGSSDCSDGRVIRLRKACTTSRLDTHLLEHPRACISVHLHPRAAYVRCFIQAAWCRRHGTARTAAHKTCCRQRIRNRSTPHMRICLTTT